MDDKFYLSLDIIHPTTGELVTIDLPTSYADFISTLRDYDETMDELSIPVMEIPSYWRDTNSMPEFAPAIEVDSVKSNLPFSDELVDFINGWGLDIDKLSAFLVNANELVDNFGIVGAKEILKDYWSGTHPSNILNTRYLPNIDTVYWMDDVTSVEDYGKYLYDSYDYDESFEEYLNKDEIKNAILDDNELIAYLDPTIDMDTITYYDLEILGDDLVKKYIDEFGWDFSRLTDDESYIDKFIDFYALGQIGEITVTPYGTIEYFK